MGERVSDDRIMLCCLNRCTVHAYQRLNHTSRAQHIAGPLLIPTARASRPKQCIDRVMSVKLKRHLASVFGTTHPLESSRSPVRCRDTIPLLLSIANPHHRADLTLFLASPPSAQWRASRDQCPNCAVAIIASSLGVCLFGKAAPTLIYIYIYLIRGTTPRSSNPRPADTIAARRLCKDNPFFSPTTTSSTCTKP